MPHASACGTLDALKPHKPAAKHPGIGLQWRYSCGHFDHNRNTGGHLPDDSHCYGVNRTEPAHRVAGIACRWAATVRRGTRAYPKLTPERGLATRYGHLATQAPARKSASALVQALDNRAAWTMGDMCAHVHLLMIDRNLVLIDRNLVPTTSASSPAVGCDQRLVQSHLPWMRKCRAG